MSNIISSPAESRRPRPNPDSMSDCLRAARMCVRTSRKRTQSHFVDELDLSVWGSWTVRNGDNYVAPFWGWRGVENLVSPRNQFRFPTQTHSLELNIMHQKGRRFRPSLYETKKGGVHAEKKGEEIIKINPVVVRSWMCVWNRRGLLLPRLIISFFTWTVNTPPERRDETSTFCSLWLLPESGTFLMYDDWEIILSLESTKRRRARVCVCARRKEAYLELTFNWYWNDTSDFRGSIW